jgi:hypothetical protein
VPGVRGPGAGQLQARKVLLAVKTVIDFNRYKDEPHAFVQWKGTDACMDVRCECGTNGHIDGDFVYGVTCRDCGKKYEVEPFVRLLPIDDHDHEAVVEFFDAGQTRCHSTSAVVDALDAIYLANVLPPELQGKAWAALRKAGR